MSELRITAHHIPDLTLVTARKVCAWFFIFDRWGKKFAVISCGEYLDSVLGMGVRNVEHLAD